MDQPLKRSMAPVGATAPTLLLLGSLPGAASLAAQSYYAHPQNQFWRLLGNALGEPLAESGYAVRLERLASRGVALWDVVGEARRSGSLDSALRDVLANPLAAFIERQPRLAAIGFNGQTAARIGRKVLGEQRGIALIDLPSSSAAHTLAIAQKAVRWSVLANFATAATLA
ncbi:MAG: DNA-deoxyinosine glycosylase [Sphingomonas bacterium]|nr:DNA-deoxyinosine glycosylase [Sphingomonas bacterium]